MITALVLIELLLLKINCCSIIIRWWHHSHLTRAILGSIASILLVLLRSSIRAISTISARLARRRCHLRLVVEPIQHIVKFADSISGVFLLLGGAHRIAFGPLRTHRRVVSFQVANRALYLPIVLNAML